MSPELRLHGTEWEQGEFPKEKGHTNPNEPQCLSEDKLSRAENCSLKGKCDLQMLTEQRAVPLLPPASCCYSDSSSSSFRSPDMFWESADAGVGTSDGAAEEPTWHIPSPSARAATAAATATAHVLFVPEHVSESSKDRKSVV